MKTYKYSAKTTEGRTVNGSLQASDQNEVVGELRKRNLTILNNMPSAAMPASYPVRLHFDGSTTPTAAGCRNT